jgi:hypothetical protein
MGADLVDPSESDCKPRILVHFRCAPFGFTIGRRFLKKVSYLPFWMPWPSMTTETGDVSTCRDRFPQPSNSQRRLFWSPAIILEVGSLTSEFRQSRER